MRNEAGKTSPAFVRCNNLISGSMPRVFNLDQIVIEKTRDGRGHNKCRDQHKTPFEQKLPGIAAGVAEAEQKPRPGQKRHGHQPPLLPVSDRLAPLIRMGRQPGENAFQRQQGHASHKGPFWDRSALPESGQQCRDPAQQGGDKSENGSISHWLKAHGTTRAPNSVQPLYPIPQFQSTVKCRFFDNRPSMRLRKGARESRQ